MKIRNSLSLLFVLLIAISLFATQPASAVAPDHGALAFGRGSFSFFNGFRTEGWAYSFEAMANKNGQAHGRAVFDIADTFMQTQTHVVVRINCLNVQGSAEFAAASIRGTVLQSDNPEFPKNANVVFGAEDDSGSPTIRPDIITRLFAFDGDCDDFALPLTLFFQSPDAIHIEP